MTEREAHIAFNLADRIGSVALAKMVVACGSAAAAWNALPAEMKVSRSGGEIDVARELALAKRYGVDIITAVDPEYPARLKDCKSYPLCLYVKGSLEALKGRTVAIVGTRKPSPYGLDHAFLIAKGLAERGVCVISGLAVGIDAASHKGALEGGGATIGVLGSALDEFYPDANRGLAREMIKSHGAVISQFPFGRSCDATTFPIRNEIVAALSEAVVAIEAPVKSGTLITCRDALDLGRQVMALPGRVDSRASEGCLDLIHDGALMIRNADDICRDLGVKNLPPPDELAPAPECAAPRYSIEESIIMREVPLDGISMERLAEKTGLAPAKVSALCMGLRLKDALRFLPCNRVAFPRSK